MFEVNAATDWFAMVARGYKWRDRAIIQLVLTVSSRPGFRRLMDKLLGECDFVITVKTQNSSASLVFNSLCTSELTVMDELLVRTL